MNDETLKRLQDTELEILKFIDKFCDMCNIKYSLYAGTALGAVRHKGFIPWDDDVDIFMEREEYNKFKQKWEEIKPEGFFFQNPNESNEPINHAKIRKNGTMFISEGREENGINDGIFVDIFPMDKIKNTNIAKLKMLFWGTLYIVFKRNYPAKKNGKIIYFITYLMMLLPQKTKKRICDKASNKITMYSELKEGYGWRSFSCLDDLKLMYPQDIIGSYSRIEFCGCEFMINERHKEMLELYFGDYMQLPPVEERICKHNPKKIVFDKADYE